MIDPFKPKYFPLYWRIAFAAAAQSSARRHKVGAVLITRSGMLAPGWNGMPPGGDNDCEIEDWFDPVLGTTRLKTKPEVIHAEHNAINKLARQGVAIEGARLFVTRAPCFDCAKDLLCLGLSGVHYAQEHDDMRGVQLLARYHVPLQHEPQALIYADPMLDPSYL